MPRCAAAAAAQVEASYRRVVSVLRGHHGKDTLKLPGLYRRGTSERTMTVGGLMLVYFASRLGQITTKLQLVRFLRSQGCDTPDPQPRHLGMQIGLNFLVQGCLHAKERRVLKQGEYCLLDLKHLHPNFESMHRTVSASFNASAFQRLKALYDDRCACCGSVEGRKHLKNRHMITRLEKGHCDPRRPLSWDNCVPMCTTCNMVYKNRAVFNRRGFIVEWLSSGSGSSCCPPPSSSSSSLTVTTTKKKKKKKRPVP